MEKHNGEIIQFYSAHARALSTSYPRVNIFYTDCASLFICIAYTSLSTHKSKLKPFRNNVFPILVMVFPLLLAFFST